MNIPKRSGRVVYEERGDVMVVRLTGELDHHGAVSVRSEIDRVLSDKRPQRVYLDLSAIRFMDSSGLGLIMGRYALVKRYGGSLAALDPAEAVIRIMNLAGLERMVPIVKSQRKEGKHESNG